MATNFWWSVRPEDFRMCEIIDNLYLATKMGQVDFVLPVGTHTRFIFPGFGGFHGYLFFAGMTSAVQKYLLEEGYFHIG